MKKISESGWDYEIFEGKSNVGIVLIHEVFGLDDYIRDCASNLASKGFTVAAVDLYHGRYESNLENSMVLRSSVTRSVLLECVSHAQEILRREIKSSNKRIGAMGFCMGGGFALYSACHLNLDFSIVYYGSIDEVDDLKDLKGPIILIEGLDSERDMNWVRDGFVPSITKYKKRVDMHFYPEAGHAFHRQGTPRHNAEAAKDAWEKTISFTSQLSA